VRRQETGCRPRDSPEFGQEAARAPDVAPGDRCDLDSIEAGFGSYSATLLPLQRL
jgi:hypothetical protein